jgi:hypothetical protein
MLIPGLFQALTKEYFVRTTIIMAVTMAVVVLGDLVGTTTDPIAEHAVVTTIIAVTILAINVTKGPIITTLVDLVILAQVIAITEIVPITEIVTAEVVTITEIVTAEVDTQIAIHVLAHIQALVEDLAINAAIALEDGGEMALVIAPILGNQLPQPLQIMEALLILVTPKFLFFKE